VGKSLGLAGQKAASAGQSDRAKRYEQEDILYKKPRPDVGSPICRDEGTAFKEDGRRAMCDRKASGGTQ
jgi:hypothetical protein